MSIYTKLADIQAQLDDVTTRELTTAGSARLTSYLSASSITASNGMVTSLTASNLNSSNATLLNSQASILTVNENLLVVNKDENNRVGIGTNAPTAVLSVNGTSHFTGSMTIGGGNYSLTVANVVSGTTAQVSVLKLVSRTQPGGGSLGMMYVSSDDNKLYFHNGTTWKEVAFV